MQANEAVGCAQMEYGDSTETDSRGKDLLVRCWPIGREGRLYRYSGNKLIHGEVTDGSFMH